MPNASMVTQTWPHRALQVDLGGGEHICIYIYIYVYIYVYLSTYLSIYLYHISMYTSIHITYTYVYALGTHSLGMWGNGQLPKRKRLFSKILVLKRCGGPRMDGCGAATQQHHGEAWHDSTGGSALPTGSPKREGSEVGTGLTPSGQLKSCLSGADSPLQRPPSV